MKYKSNLREALVILVLFRAKVIRAITRRGFIGLMMAIGLSLMATTGTLTTTMLCVEWLFGA